MLAGILIFSRSVSGKVRATCVLCMVSVHMVGWLIAALFVASCEIFRISKLCRISKFPKQKYISVHSEQLRFVVAPPHERSDLSDHCGLCMFVGLFFKPTHKLSEVHRISKIPKQKYVSGHSEQL